MQFDSACTRCLVEREYRNAHKRLSPEFAHEHLLDILKIMAEAPKGVSAPYLIPLFAGAMEKYGITGDLYAKEKKDSNALARKMLPRAEAIIRNSTDPLLTALKFAQAGNFMDFGVLTLETVDEKVRQAVEDAPNAPLDEAEYENFLLDLQAASSLLILGDNAGEIVFDTLLVKQLQARFPALGITYCVRGGNCLNDATREDAAISGMDRLVRVIDNGTCISATELAYIGEELRCAMAEADVILAKGQANFEILAGCGYPIYYNFFCKCDRLSRILNKPLFTGQFLFEKRLGAITPFPAEE